MRRVPLPLLACAGLLVVGHLWLWLAMPLAIEDAYITFRYAANLVAGHGLVYNLGERVMGFTSLPWTLWCALGLGLHVDPVAWTRGTSLLADLGTLWLGWQMLSGSARLSFSVFFAGWPLFAAAAGSGLETSAFLFLIMLAACQVSEYSPRAGLALGLLAVMRPEGLLAAAVIGLAAEWRERLIALCVFLLAVAATTIYFGSPIPQSVIAKAALYGTPGPLAGSFWYEWLVPGLFSGHAPRLSECLHLLPVMAVFIASAVVGVRELGWRSLSGASLAAGAGIAIWLGYAASGTAYFWWYIVPPFGAFALLGASGFPHIARGRALPIAVSVMMLGTWNAAAHLYGGRAGSEADSFGRAAGLIAENARSTDSVFLEPIGYVGYRTGLRVIDEVGLVSPQLVSLRSRGAGWYADEVKLERPTWLVVRPAVISSSEAFAGTGAPFRSLAERDQALADYDLLATGTISVYRRKT
jgi:hypothetical protein